VEPLATEKRLGFKVEMLPDRLGHGDERRLAGAAQPGWQRHQVYRYGR
jgi:hypothetical protein